MRDGITDGLIPAQYPYSKEIQSAATAYNVSAFLLYAIACNETIIGEVAGKWNAATVESADGGHGLFQLTSSYPDDWQDPQVNANYAATDFIVPLWKSCVEIGFFGDDLVRAISAAFNAGFSGMMRGHEEQNNVDAFTTDKYGLRALQIYAKLVTGATLF